MEIDDSISDEEINDELDIVYDIEDEEIISDIFNTNTSVKKKYIINDADRTTSNRVTKYELTRAITYRITQIERGSKYFINTGNLNTATDIAKKEVMERKSPIIIERVIDLDKKLNIVYCERWKLNNMAYPENFIFL